MNKKVYTNFDEYVKAHPEGEEFRSWVCGVKVDRPVRETILLPTYPDHNGLPGNYFWAYIVEWEGSFAVRISDCDEICITKEFKTEVEAAKMLSDLATCVPFTMKEAIEVLKFKVE